MTNGIETIELSVFEKISNDFKVVFDVGCRADVDYARLRPDCFFHLFEPNPEFVKELRENVKKHKLKNVKINMFGLSDVVASLPYWERSQSFLFNPEFKKALVGDIAEHKFPIKTLDGYAKRIKKIDFLKIDTEGFDLKVIQGGTKTLKKTNYIQFEYWDSVKKFLPFLKDFKLYLINDSALSKYLAEFMKTDLTLVPLDENVINIIENGLIPKGYGGNIHGVRHNILL